MCFSSERGSVPVQAEAGRPHRFVQGTVAAYPETMEDIDKAEHEKEAR